MPTYITAIAAKDAVEAWLPRPASPTPGDELSRSAVKSVAAGVAGAALTNPLDVLRNEMFKTELGVVATYRKLVRRAECGRGRKRVTGGGGGGYSVRGGAEAVCG